MASWMERAARRLDLPAEAVGGTTRVTLTGADRVLVENHKGLLCCTDTEVAVSCGRGCIRISGAELLLRAMDAEMLVVTGRIAGVEVE
ncbi:MAG: sporulation protein [Oscillospiraceae bacterium]|nr:sporulation protein [Oscillospiraceae bacterium]